MKDDWNPSAEGSKERGKMPSSAFLEPGEKKYPYKVNRGGKWVPSQAGLEAAYKRARQQGATATAEKAARKLKSIFGHEVGK
jgi:hypothetical protein